MWRSRAFFAALFLCVSLSAIQGMGDTGVTTNTRTASPGSENDDFDYFKRGAPVADLGELRAQAEKGVPSAQVDLGDRFARGNGVPRDLAEAVKWYRKAAAKNNPRAEYNLGVAYANGESVQQNDKEAVRWYRKAADHGHAAAQYNLGLSYSRGVGVSKDQTKAAALFKKSAEQGDLLAQIAWAAVNFNGQGVQTNLVEASTWLSVAAESDVFRMTNVRQSLQNLQMRLSLREREESERRAAEILQRLRPSSKPPR